MSESPVALDVSHAEELRDMLAAEGGAHIALVEPPSGKPFYVGLNASGELVRIERS